MEKIKWLFVTKLGLLVTNIWRVRVAEIMPISAYPPNQGESANLNKCIAPK